MLKKRKYESGDYSEDSAGNERDRQIRMREFRKWRLIVRNIPFTCVEEDIRSSFSPFGKIEEIVLPAPKKKGLGQNAGFAFVQFRSQESAKEAMDGMNEKKIQSRQVAVDWAVPKDEYVTAFLEEQEREGKRKNLESMLPRAQKRNKREEKRPTDKPSTSDDDEDANEDETPILEVPKKKRKVKEENEPRAAKSTSEEDEGVKEGRTIFIRNIPFDVVEDELEKIFASFGRFNYCVICKYPGTDHSKGSGFVQFKEKEAAEKCLEQASDLMNGGIRVHGQLLTLCLAISKESARKMEKQKHDHQPKDKRNLHLLRVGLIRAGTADAVGVSESDLAKRMRIESGNRQKINDFNIFVSPTRLCVHNLPTSVDDKRLKAICLKMVDDKNAWIKECRIMRDFNRPNSLGVGKSLGYGFVEFTEHDHATACLKNLNNNAEIFTNEKRPIVEFSLENRNALLVKEQRAEKARMKAAEQKNLQANGTSAAANSGKKSKLNKKPKFVVPTAPAASGSQGDSGKKRKAFPSHFGPKIRHRKRDAPKETGRKKDVKKKPSRTMKRKADGQGKKPETESQAQDRTAKRKKSATRKQDGKGKKEKRNRWFEK